MRPGRRSPSYHLVAIPGDGVGPDVVAAARRVLEATGDGLRLRHRLGRDRSPAAPRSTRSGWRSAPRTSPAAPPRDAILLGAVGGPRWDDPRAAVRPEQALFALRGGLGLFANLRPVAVHPALVPASPLRPELLEGVDLLDRPRADRRPLLRGAHGGGRRRPARAPRQRHRCRTRSRRSRASPGSPSSWPAAGGGALTSVDKANVLATSRLWRTVVHEIAAEFPDVALEHRLVDACAMQLVRTPAAFDVLVTENLFGDILSDEASRAGRLARDAALGLDRDAPDGPRPARPLRADPRLRAGHRRAATWRTRSGRSCPRRCSCAGRWAGAEAADAIEAAVGRRPRRRLPDGRPLAASTRRWRRAARRVGTVGDGRRDRRPDRRLPGRPPERRPPEARWRHATRPTTTGPPGTALSAPPDRSGRATPPVILYDTTLRDGTQGENIILSLADKLRDRPDARRVRDALHRGRLAGLQPEGRRVLRARPRRCAGSARSWPPSAPPATGRTGPRPTRTCASWWRPRRPSSRSSARAGCSTSPRSWAPRPAENLDMIAESVGFLVERGREAVYDAEHYFDGYRADRAVRARHAAGGPRRPAPARWSCATRTAAPSPTSCCGSSARRGRPRGRPRRARPSPGGSTPTTTPSSRSPTRSPPSQAGDPPRPGHDQRLRRALRQREHGERPGQPRPQDGPTPSCRPAAARWPT